VGAKMNLDIMKNIKLGKYNTVQQLARSQIKHDEEFLAMAFDTGSVAIYVYCCLLILGKETSDSHEKASNIMNMALVYYNGYSCGIMHQRRMIRFSQNNIGYLSHLLYDNYIPDHLVRDDEAYQICLHILSIDPLHKFANKTKNRIENSRLYNVLESDTYIPHDDQSDDFVRLVHTGFYEQAKVLVSDYSYDELKALLLTLMQRHQSVAFYTYAFFMLLDQETARGHLLAGQLLMQLKDVFGAESGALFHARRAVELAPQSLEYLEFLLSFYTLPEPLLTNEEAQACAEQMIVIDPKHGGAHIVLEKL
jgi:hypothetical protein